MTIAWHVVLGAYGFWLPNDPRGSWSDFVSSPALSRFGEATKVQARRSLAREPHDHRRRLQAKRALQHPPVRLTGRQARAVAHGFAEAIQEGRYTTYACCILPEHAHLVLARADRPIGRVVGHLKGRATRCLRTEGLWPDRRPLWAHGFWKVFLHTPADVRRAIAYVEGNPPREGKPTQRWPFVTPFPGDCGAG